MTQWAVWTPKALDLLQHDLHLRRAPLVREAALALHVEQQDKELGRAHEAHTVPGAEGVAPGREPDPELATATR